MEFVGKGKIFVSEVRRSGIVTGTGAGSSCASSRLSLPVGSRSALLVSDFLLILHLHFFFLSSSHTDDSYSDLI